MHPKWRGCGNHGCRKFGLEDWPLQSTGAQSKRRSRDSYRRLAILLKSTGVQCLMIHDMSGRVPEQVPHRM